MLVHIAKLIWNRKRSNAMIIVEIVITFLIIFLIVSFSISNYHKFNQPLGFSWENTWSITTDSSARWNDKVDTAITQNLLNMLEQQDEVAHVSLTRTPFFRNSTWSSITPVNGKDFYYEVNVVNQQGPKDWGVQLVSGRWFSEKDDGQNYSEVVVSQSFVKQALGDVDPINFDIVDPDYPDDQPKRIVGVMANIKPKGEFSEATPYLLYRYKFSNSEYWDMRNIQLMFKKEMPASYQEVLLKRLKGIAPQWDFEIKSWKELRTSQINEVLTPLIIMAVVVGFLLLMVAMGLFGILFQDINRRTREIGLRRAIGAGESSIKLQIIGELIAVALMGILIGMFFLIQVPLLELLEWVSWGNFWISSLGSTGIILLMVVLCALYPSRVAIKMPPASALHYE